MKLLVCYGTRPEWIKIKPLFSELDKVGICYEVLFTGQHTSLMDECFFDKSLSIKDGINRLDMICATILEKSHEIFQGFSHILVQGDTATVFALAIGAYHSRKKIIHLEAGLRTYNLEQPNPEEAYRQMVSRIASIHLCPTEIEKKYLEAEKVSGDIFVVGNTVLDNLVDLKTSYGENVLVTMHRRENHESIEEWFSEISKCALESSKKWIIPLHPNPNIQKHKNLLGGLDVIKPLGHNDLLDLMKDCAYIVTDSGGLQEEGSFLNKKIVVCREDSERVLGLHASLCPSPQELSEIVKKIEQDPFISCASPYGDGQSSKRIAHLLLEYI